jgi:hypothetical protein
MVPTVTSGGDRPLHGRYMVAVIGVLGALSLVPLATGSRMSLVTALGSQAVGGDSLARDAHGMAAAAEPGPITQPVIPVRPDIPARPSAPSGAASGLSKPAVPSGAPDLGLSDPASSDLIKPSKSKKPARPKVRRATPPHSRPITSLVPSGPPKMARSIPGVPSVLGVNPSGATTSQLEPGVSGPSSISSPSSDVAGQRNGYPAQVPLSGASSQLTQQAPDQLPAQARVPGQVPTQVAGQLPTQVPGQTPDPVAAGDPAQLPSHSGPVAVPGPVVLLPQQPANDASSDPAVAPDSLTQ